MEQETAPETKIPIWRTNAPGAVSVSALVAEEEEVWAGVVRDGDRAPAVAVLGSGIGT